MHLAVKKKLAFNQFVPPATNWGKSAISKASYDHALAEA